MHTLDLSTDKKTVLTNKIQNYLLDEFDCEAGQFDTEFFLDFLTKELGAHFYNQGLYDSQVILAKKIDDINEAITELELET